LAGLLVEKSLLERMWTLSAAQAFNRDDLFARDAPDRFGAAFLRRAVDQDHATSALFEPAAKPRAYKAKLVTQNVEKRRFLVRDRNADRIPVDGKIDFFRHARS
jgi:hypothetical protein